MGIQDRDYFWEDHARRQREFGGSSGRRGGPPRLPGGGLHWAAQAAVWLAVAASLFGVFKLVEVYRENQRQAHKSAVEAAQWKARAEQAERQLDAYRKAQRIDFFKR